MSTAVLNGLLLLVYLPLSCEVSSNLCSYLGFKDQCRSLRGINRRCNQLFKAQNNEWIQRSESSKNEFKSLLSKTSSVPRNAAIFKLHRLLMLNEEYSLQWMYVLKEEFGGTLFSYVIYLQCKLEMKPIPSPGTTNYRAFNSILKRIRAVDSEYQCPFDLDAFEGLSISEQHLVQLSRGITFSVFNSIRDHINGYMYSNRLNTAEYLYTWEYLQFLDVLPDQHHMFDDEAIHSKSMQMLKLRHLISKCGLMVIHPKHIRVAMESKDSGMIMFRCMMRMRQKLPLPTADGNQKQAVHEMNSRWLIAMFEKFKTEGYQWPQKVLKEQQIHKVLTIFSETKKGASSLTQGILEDHIRELNEMKAAVTCNLR